MPLPPYDPEGSAELPPLIEALKSEASRAAGFVLGSPTYHNSYSGLLKTALDHLSPDDFRGKPVALVGVGRCSRWTTCGSWCGACSALRSRPNSSSGTPISPAAPLLTCAGKARGAAGRRD